MPLKFVLDTNTCIFAIKNKPDAVQQAFNRRQGQLCISAITAMELACGAEKSTAPTRNHAVVDGFLKRLEVLDYDHDAAADSGQLRAELARAGTPIGPYDAMIAGHTRSRGLVLVTNNTREFSRVPGLRLDAETLSLGVRRPAVVPLSYRCAVLSATLVTPNQWKKRQVEKRLGRPL